MLDKHFRVFCVPHTSGNRYNVYDILAYFPSGMTQAEILADFPYLTQEDILASDYNDLSLILGTSPKLGCIHLPNLEKGSKVRSDLLCYAA
jgi:hypothetical protein